MYLLFLMCLRDSDRMNAIVSTKREFLRNYIQVPDPEGDSR